MHQFQGLDLCLDLCRFHKALLHAVCFYFRQCFKPRYQSVSFLFVLKQILDLGFHGLTFRISAYDPKVL